MNTLLVFALLVLNGFQPCRLMNGQWGWKRGFVKGPTKWALNLIVL